MSQFFISCKESRIESNRSFYGCFSLGPFEPSQSITIANTLRRTLLSELYGLAIVSVEIEGASHEYSSLPGVRESILDILLNLKEIVLKKTIKNFKPQIGYLRARGPGVVYASHLRLPPFIQCVDPSQYIASLADNGFLNMKFTIQYGNKWVSKNPLNSNFKQDLVETDPAKLETSNRNLFSVATPFSEKGTKRTSKSPFLKKTNGKNEPPFASLPFAQQPLFREAKGKGGVATHGANEILTSNKPFLLLESHLKKRRLILKKLKQIGLASSNSYIKMFVSTFLKKDSSNFLLKKKKKATQEKNPISLKSAQFLDHYRKKRNISRKNRFLMDFNSNFKKKRNLSPFPSVCFPFPPFPLPQRGKGRVANGGIGKATPFLATRPFPLLRKPSPFGKAKRGVATHGDGKGTKRRLQKVVSRKLKNKVSLMNSGLIKKENIFLNSNPLTIDAIFNPINKINYIIELNDFKMSPSKLQTSFESSELYEILRNIKKPNTLFSESTNLKKLTSNKVEKTLKNSFFKVFEENKKSKLSEELEIILKIKNELSPFILKRETTKHNIILEIWTNGSIHPRDALYQGFKNLIKLFAKLKKINTFGVNIFSLKKDPELLYFTNKENAFRFDSFSYEGTKRRSFLLRSNPSPSPIPSLRFPLRYARGWEGVATQMGKGTRSKKREGIAKSKKKEEDLQSQRSSFSQPVLKKIKMDEIRPVLFQNLLPLDETSFLSTYVAPKLKNYYLKN